MKFKKGELPPIKRKTKVYEKKEIMPPPPKVDFKKKNNFKKPKPKEPLLDNSRNNTLFDKCPHFFGNYFPKFACCNKFYACYLCHNEYETIHIILVIKFAVYFVKLFMRGKVVQNAKQINYFKEKMFKFYFIFLII